MRRANVNYRPQAIADLQGIYRVIAEASQSDGVAAGFVQRIMARCRKIGHAPNGGRPRDDLEPGLRNRAVRTHGHIAYRVTDNVEITKVFYGGRDYEALYHAGEPD